MTQKVYGRGLNTFGQLALTKTRTLSQFTPISTLQGIGIKQIDSHFTNNVALLDDNQVIYWGWAMDLLTQVRTLNWYKQGPRVVHTWQRLAPFGKYLSIRNFHDEPTLINRSIMHQRITKLQLGGCFIQAQLENGELFGMGENYKGQLGVGNIKFQHEFSQVHTNAKQKVIDIAAGLQHSLFLNDQGVVYGSGRSNWSQIMGDEHITVEFFQRPMKMEMANRWITKIASGFHHSLVLSRDNKLFAWGMNTHGQCGTSNLSEQTVSQPHQVFLPQGAIVKDIVCGKSHSAFFTSDNRVFVFGANNHNQLGRKSEFDLDVCSPQEVHLSLGPDENIVSIKARFDRTCIITDQGNAYIWGGEDLRHLGGEYYPQIENMAQSVEGCVRNVSLGYMHTLLVCE